MRARVRVRVRLGIGVKVTLSFFDAVVVTEASTGCHGGDKLPIKKRKKKKTSMAEINYQ